jgi:pyrimidine-specific ribonucleoside hydrolase
VDLRLVTTVHGNVELAQTTENALRVLHLAGRADVPVAAGARAALVHPQAERAGHVHGATGLGGVDLPPSPAALDPRPAVVALADVLLSSREPVTVATIGPLTNLALLLGVFPEAAERIGRLVVMGGSAARGGNVTAAAEFNIWADPEAARRACTSGLDVTMVGLDVTHQALFTREESERIRRRGVAGRLTADLVDYYARSHPHMPGTPIHDAVAVAQVIDPSLLELEHCHVEVDCGPVSRGRTLVDRFHVTGHEPNVRAATAIDPGFTAWMSERIASLG